GKGVFDLGCNSGGMLIELADKITHGVGVDFNPRLINVANLIRSAYHHDNISFYNFDLRHEPTSLLNDLATEKIDVCLMLSIAAYLPNWKELVKWCSDTAPTLVFEAHGTVEFIDEQIKCIKSIYSDVQTLTKIGNYDDNTDGEKSRQLFLCNK
ncbi:unnamed protein product, partial [marine sediment metagenome]